MLFGERALGRPEDTPLSSEKEKILTTNVEEAEKPKAL